MLMITTSRPLVASEKSYVADAITEMEFGTVICNMDAAR